VNAATARFLAEDRGRLRSSPRTDQGEDQRHEQTKPECSLRGLASRRSTNQISQEPPGCRSGGRSSRCGARFAANGAQRFARSCAAQRPTSRSATSASICAPRSSPSSSTTPRADRRPPLDTRLERRPRGPAAPPQIRRRSRRVARQAAYRTYWIDVGARGVRCRLVWIMCSIRWIRSLAIRCRNLAICRPFPKLVAIVLSLHEVGRIANPLDTTNRSICSDFLGLSSN